MVYQVIFLISAGLLGAFLGQLFRIPVSMVLGPMFMVGIFKHFRIILLHPASPLSFTIQILLGVMLGLSFHKIAQEEFKKLGLSLIIIFIGVIIMAFGTGILVNQLVEIDIKTLLLATTPGGVPEMSTTAQALSLNAPIVAMFHLIRISVIMAIFPIILRFVYKRKNKGGDSG